LKNESEGLIIKRNSDKKYRLIDPYQLFDTIEINESIDDKNVITKLNRKVFIDFNSNICITDGLGEVQQTKISIYTLSTFKFIQEMLKDIIKEDNYKDVPFEFEFKDGNRIVLERGKHYHRIVLKRGNSSSVYFTNSYILLLNLLNNQYLVLIDTSGIRILEIIDNSLSCRYYWYNDEWNEKFENFLNNKDDSINGYIPFIKKVLANEFNDSKSSIPCPRFFIPRRLSGNLDAFYDFKGFINDIQAFSKFGSEILKIAINDKNDDVIQHIINEALKLIKDNHNYMKYDKNTSEPIKNNDNYMAWLPFINLNLPKLCNDYPDFLIKFLTRTSIILSPACNAIKRSTNTSLNSHLSICIEKSNLGNDYFKSISSFFKRLIQNLRIQEEVQTVSFIVPFPQICVYQDDSKNNDHENRETTILKKMITGLKKIMMIPKSNSVWNEFLYKPKSILFCNIDSEHFYNWWNFAAIVDYKWKTFGRVYYYLIWLFYTIFYACYSLASTLEQKSIPDFYFELLFIISIIIGSIFLIFEIRHFLWDYKRYFNDIWNLFGK
jgi:hypothetical protein